MYVRERGEGERREEGGGRESKLDTGVGKNANPRLLSKDRSISLSLSLSLSLTHAHTHTHSIP